MSIKLRSVNTKFWDDPFVEELSPSEKLLFLYLLTNPLTNLLGIYEITIKRISYDTGLTQEMVRKGLERFGKAEKVFCEENFIVLLNFLKNQNLNSNMKISVKRDYDKLPNSLKIKYALNDKEWFLMVRNDSGMPRKIEDEYEYESEVESEEELQEKTPPQKTWREDFSIYKKNLLSEFENILRDIKWVEDQERLNPNVDIPLTMEKSIKNYWGTEAGWKNKKKSKAEEPNWKLTFSKTMDINKVYKQNRQSFYAPKQIADPKLEKI